MKRRNLTLLGASALLCAMTGATYAQGKFPDKPITLVVPSAPGGTTDFTARLVADQLSTALGQPVIVENKAGGAGNIGNQAVARAKPDGYTLLVAYSGYQVGNPHLFKKAGWDPIKDFEPVAMMTRAPQVVVIKTALPFKSMQELITFAKANPGKLNYASSGNGSIQHIAAEMLQQQTGTEMTHVPYKGAAPAVQDLLGGNVDMFITTPASVVSQIKAGKMKPLAVTSDKRLPSLPDVPTVAEAGLPQFKLDSWFALYAPAGTPADVVQTLNQAVSKILQQPDVKKKAEDSGTTTEVMTPVQLGAYTKKELEFWGQVIKKAAITLD
ncbi:Bug family tripartite tricarboxylate transporter substrate binding protein [Hydrogenophaga sp. SL48]|uniref:Bug family tripartite tricarboxylate transporter substrate binding protein n=1 Tax=Hydrogenophaga sp. SL48 TaxID=2806347 RepID=UPI001F1B1E9A|nr:tripartite tricarboxylate transporter substrate binding protein [Hydrogenophaga sp. SL48]UJW81153.1 tripartite tricarboxylate transporter substrate binding protein [Hydrogenophaga sp. SL48]